MFSIEDAGQATEVAISFVKKHRPLHWGTPVKATKADGTWVVEIDLGIFAPRIGKVTIDAQSGKITEYHLPS